MTSSFSTIKLGEKLSLPENIICYVTYKDKTYYELTHGNYNLTRELLIDLFKKQYKVEEKPKNLAVDLFFVNTSPMKKELVFRDKVSIHNDLIKTFVRLYLTLQVVNPKEFSNYIRAEFAYVTAKDTDKFIFDDIEYITSQFLKRKNFDDYYIPLETEEDLKNKLSKKLASVGLNLSNFKIEFDSTKNKEKRSEFDFFTPELEKRENPKQETQPAVINQVVENKIEETVSTQTEKIQRPINVNKNICPVCKSKRIPNSIYCIRCGNKFDD